MSDPNPQPQQTPRSDSPPGATAVGSVGDPASQGAGSPPTPWDELKPDVREKLTEYHIEICKIQIELDDMLRNISRATPAERPTFDEMWTLREMFSKLQRRAYDAEHYCFMTNFEREVQENLRPRFYPDQEPRPRPPQPKARTTDDLLSDL